MSSDPLRIAIFRRDLMGGGAERNLVVLAHYFADAGFKVDIVLSLAEGTLLDTVTKNVRIVDLKAGKA